MDDGSDSGKPVTETQKGLIQIADPYVLREGNTFYAYGTSSANGIISFKSTDLRKWYRCGKADGGLALHKNDVTPSINFWAPEVYKINGKYLRYLYFVPLKFNQGATPTQPGTITVSQTVIVPNWYETK
ncbi:MAG: family 43 glycosylhydrolase [Bacteroidales bacterium]|nr:family 43 glycosylhydrolase [Bacteroidales bacterium]